MGHLFFSHLYLCALKGSVNVCYDFDQKIILGNLLTSAAYDIGTYTCKIILPSVDQVENRNLNTANSMTYHLQSVYSKEAVSVHIYQILSVSDCLSIVYVSKVTHSKPDLKLQL